MALMLLHLSDLHIRGPRDQLLVRSHLIAQAVRNFDYRVEAAVIVCTGDIAFEGSQEQYLLAVDFFAELTSSLGQALQAPGNAATPPVYLVMVPGNHDCDFSGSLQTRAMVAHSIRESQEKDLGADVLDVCMAPQQAFFDFLRAVEVPHRAPKGDEGKLFYQYEIPVSGRIIRFLCCNTAWLSQLDEVPGSLVYPTEVIAPSQTGDALVVVLLHHPFNWLLPENARAVAERLATEADIVLTGHEHEATRRLQQTDLGCRTEFVEGGVLDATASHNTTAFNVFVVDLLESKQRFSRYYWNGELYVPGDKNRAPTLMPIWEELPRNPRRLGSGFVPTPETLKRLADPGVLLTHRTRGVLTLPDIFVYPDLREVNLRREGLGRIMRGESVLPLITQAPFVLITGDTQSGKTTFAKVIFDRMLATACIPILLDGATRPPLGERLFSFLDEQFVDQYGLERLEAYRQEDRSRRVLIIDNYHKLRYGAKQRRALLSRLAQYAGHVVLLAHELALSLDDLTTPEGTTQLPQLHIQPFGHLRRNRLVEQWLLLGSDDPEEQADFVHRLATLTRTLDSLIGKNYVPAYPVYILAVLQAAEAATPIDTRASTQGYFYELFIRAALARGRTSSEFDVLSSYLAFLAFGLFERGLRDCGIEVFQEIHTAFEKRYDLTRSGKGMLELLTGRDILLEVHGRYAFKYDYMYYYFLASYLRDHIQQNAIREHIQRLSRALYLEDNANTMLFLAHLSKDPLIVQELVVTAKDQYKDDPPSAFGDDVAFLSGFEQLPPPVYEEDDPAKVREELLTALDAGESAEAVSLEAVEESEAEESPGGLVPIDPIVRLNVALKTLQILGQVVKNFPGSLEGDVKLEIVRECLGLGLRTLSGNLGLVRANRESLVGAAASLIREVHPRISESEAVERAKQTVIGLSRVISFGMVKQISNAVGSNELGTTYKRLWSEGSTPAVDLVDVSISLDHGGKFPFSEVLELGDRFSGNPHAMAMLRMLVVQHFYLFGGDFQLKQSTCAKLGIPYVPLKRLDPARQLLAGRN